MKKLLRASAHLVAFGLIGYFWFPILKDYYETVPTYGADFLQFPSFIAFVRDHWHLPPASWKYIWYSGCPLVFDMAWLHYYLAWILTAWLTAVNAARLYLILTMVGHVVFSYLLFYELGKSAFVALALSLGLITSMNFYTGLFDGGTATFTANRMFLPLVLWLMVRYFRTKEDRFLYWAGLAMGLSCLGHVGAFPLIIYGPTMLFFFFWRPQGESWFSMKKVKDIFTLTIISWLIGAVTLYPILFLLKTRPGVADFGLNTKIQTEALTGLYDWGNPFLFLAGGVFSVLYLWRGRRVKKIRPWVWPFLALLGYILFSCYLYLVGHHPLSQAMGPGRIWWIFSLTVSALIALFWRSLFSSFSTKKKGRFWATILAMAFFLPFFSSFQLPFFRDELADETYPAGYPSNVQQAVVDDQPELIEKAIIPSWFEADSLDYHFYGINPGMLPWWSISFRLPIIKGYYHHLEAKPNDWLYWLDNTLLGEYVWHFGVPESVAKKHALFLIDWYSVRYFEGGGLPLAPYLADDPEMIEAQEEMNTEAGEPLKYYKFFDSLTSPIARATRSPAVLLVGDTVAYDTFLKTLATENLNSRYLIPIKGPELIEDLTSWELADFDAIFLYNYRYKNETDFQERDELAWSYLEAYVRQGGNLLIETGEEVIESDSSILADRGLAQLPTVFPIEITRRGELGTGWEFGQTDSDLVSKIALNKFNDLIYENAIWKLSYAEGGVRSWATPVLTQKGKIVLAAGQLGEGEVIWSGLNLPYHALYYLNEEEAGFFKSLLASLVKLGREDDLPVTVSRPTPEKVTASGSGFTGLLLKEQAYPGWRARVIQPSQVKARVYRAGPYFLYARLPAEFVNQNVTMELSFPGSFLGWFLFSLSLLVIGLVLLRLVLGGRLAGVFVKLGERWRKKTAAWWGREE